MTALSCTGKLAGALGVDLLAGPQDDPASVPPVNPARWYAQAFRALCVTDIRDYRAGVKGESETFLLVSRAVAKARRGVPWWRRWLIEQRILWELDYFRQTES